MARIDVLDHAEADVAREIHAVTLAGAAGCVAILELEAVGVDHDHIGRQLTVSTGERNAPALALNARHGFREWRRWTTEDGIPIITLARGEES